MLYAGFALLAISFAGITLAVATTPHGVIAVVMALGGLGLGFVMPNLTVFAQEAVPRTQLGIVTALLQSLRMIGGMLGTAAVGALVMALYQGSVEQAAAAAGAQSWAPRLADPQVLVSASTQQRFIQDVTSAGFDGPALVESGRASLVSAVHLGQLAGLAAALIALWRVRAVPRIVFRKREPAAPRQH